ncbi:MAG TPA: type II toxin-antitoxin system RelE/ParE family toxin [Puia sp.]|jgi:plasmid stabilization system protein ParE|nr:type II toxin-antitoxin system RelE/ParE family toxin [Puia sp.]
MKTRKITWDRQALLYFREAVRYIRKDSLQNADKVKKEVLEKINELSIRPEIHNPDKYKVNNNGNYRAFELHRMRIGYLVKEDEIIIARIRNTNQEPLDY